MKTGLWLLPFVVAVVAALPLSDNGGLLDIDSTEVNPETLAGLFEGDIDLDGENPFHRNAVRDRARRWPHGIVYYRISSSYDSAMVNTIHSAMRQIEDDTKVNGQYCVRFQPRSHEHDYVYIHSKSGCSSSIGRRGGEQSLSLTEGCHRRGTIEHELVHALGFWHEQSRPDRDQYITVMWDNIEKGHEHNFKLHPSSEADTLGMPYDYGSIMHYHAYEFAKDDNEPTLVPKQRGAVIGQRVALSPIDIVKIQLLYDCISSTPNNPTRLPLPVPGREACTFEKDMCGWRQESGDQANWILWHGDTPSHRTGPGYDHMNEVSGHYIYVEASHHEHDRARLKSRDLPSGQYCLHLFYHMYGADMGTLTINAITGSHRRALKTIRGDHGDLWLEASLEYNAHSTFNFELEGYIGKDSLSDIAVDDVTIHSGSCHSAGIVG